MLKNQILRESLKGQVNRMEQETRMILPGVQSLFGFQLVAVFTERFMFALSPFQQYLHWLALAFTAISTMLTMAPAAFHRQAEPEILSDRLINYANFWLTISLIPLMLGFCIDFYLIGIVITRSEALSVAASLALLASFTTLWFIFPAISRRRQAYRSLH